MESTTDENVTKEENKVWDKIVNFILEEKIVFCISIGFMLTGILMAFLSFPQNGGEANIFRTYISGISLGLWFVTFPIVSMDNKEKILLKLGIHVILLLATTVGASFSINYFLHNMAKGHAAWDIFYSIISILIFAYFIYLLLLCLRSFKKVIDLVKNKVFPTVEEKTTGFLNFVKDLTAGLLTLTSFATAIAGFIIAIKQLI